MFSSADIYLAVGFNELSLPEKTAFSSVYKYNWGRYGGKFSVASEYLYLMWKNSYNPDSPGLGKVCFETLENPNNSKMISKVNAFISDMEASDISDAYAYGDGEVIKIDEEIFSYYMPIGSAANDVGSKVFQIYRNDENGIGITLQDHAGRVSYQSICDATYNFNKNGDLISLDDIFSVSEDVYTKRIIDIYIDEYVELMEKERNYVTLYEKYFKRYGHFTVEELKNYFKNVHPEEFSSESENETIKDRFIILGRYLIEFIDFGPCDDLTKYGGNTIIVFQIPLNMLNDILSEEYAVK
jgi:hypothetical protein